MPSDAPPPALASEQWQSPADEAATQRMIDLVLKRAQLSKASRALKQRLQLAHYKANHGWQHNTLDQIEPKMELQAQEASRKRRAAHAELLPSSASSSSLNPAPPKRQALDRHYIDDSAFMHDQQQHHQYALQPQPSTSLYDALLAPNYSSLYATTAYGSMPSSAESHSFGAFVNGPISPPNRHRTKTPLSAAAAQSDQHLHLPSSPVSSARDESPFDPPYASSSRPSSPHRRHGSMPSISAVHAQSMQQHRGPFSPSSLQHPVLATDSRPTSRPHPLSSHDPGFAGSAKEFVQAASTLTGITGASNRDGIPALAGLDQPHRPSTPQASSSHAPGGKPKSGEEEAELMLFLAASPSPVSKRKNSSPAGLGHQSQMKGRQLFADSEHSDGGSSGSGIFSDLLMRQPSEESLPGSASSFIPHYSQPPQSAPPTLMAYPYPPHSGFSSSAPLSARPPPPQQPQFSLSGPAPIKSASSGATSSGFDVGSFFAPQQQQQPTGHFF